MRREHLELSVIGVVVVTDEEYFRILSQLPLKKTLYIGYDAAGSVAAVKGITKQFLLRSQLSLTLHKLK